jgi:hypothetical protein
MGRQFAFVGFDWPSNQPWSLRHCDVMTMAEGGDTSATLRRSLETEGRAAPSTRRGGHCAQVSLRRRDDVFDADSVITMIGRRRNSEKGEDTLRKDTRFHETWRFKHTAAQHISRADNYPYVRYS